jgi:hypothetical protein
MMGRNNRSDRLISYILVIVHFELEVSGRNITIIINNKCVIC